MRTLLAIVLLVLLASCGNVNPGRSSRQMNIPFTPDISINEVMVAQIDHASHFIWNAANSQNSVADVDWQEVEHHAIQLISSRSAISMGGTGVNDAMWVAQPSWRQYVNLMNDGAVLALTSARAKNITDLSRAGSILVESCEGCHQQYKPSIPTEGFTHPH